MKRRRPTTAGINQLSRNLSVTRSPGDSIPASILLWLPGALGGGVTTGDFFCLTGRLEAARGMAQCGGPTLAALGGLCDGGSLLTVVRGTSVGGAAGLLVAAGADGARPVAGPTAYLGPAAYLGHSSSSESSSSEDEEAWLQEGTVCSLLRNLRTSWFRQMCFFVLPFLFTFG